VLALAILGLLFVACQPVRPLPPGTAATAAPASQEEQNAALVQRCYDEFSAGNVDVILQVHPETIRMHYAGEFEDVPAQVLRDDLAAIKAANPDLQAIVHTNIAAGDYVFTELTWTTTHTGDYFGVPASGKTTAHPGIVVRRLENGKVVESWEMFDDLSFMQSIGYVPDWDTLINQGPMAD
jgi:steroid delta-isomerase-like uncharacterized protein